MRYILIDAKRSGLLSQRDHMPGRSYKWSAFLALILTTLLLAV